MADLYRPVGLYELVKIQRTGWRAYPPRLAEQPIFYPVLNREYALEIASRWNPSDPNSGYIGFVTHFKVSGAAIEPYPQKVVGAQRHVELWVPAAQQATLEAQIDGAITVLDAIAGPQLSEVLSGWTGSPGLVDPAAIPDLLALIAAGPITGGPLSAE
jgi:hypothetical protein